MATTVADTILAQLGNRCMVMLGASNAMAVENGLQFKVGKNGKKVTHIRITLDVSDTYTVEALSVRKKDGVPMVKSLDLSSCVYVDRLHATIERMTGMYTSLGTCGGQMPPAQR